MSSARVAVVLACVIVAGLAGCSDDSSGTPDAAEPDATGDSGLCGATGVFFTGELLDFDSTSASFSGINDATLTVRGDATKTDQTAPNGRFELCLSDEPSVIVDVTPSAASGYIPGIAVVSKEVASSGGYSMRSFTTTRGMAGFGFTSSKAQVFVHVAGVARDITISAAIERAYSFTGTTWDAGNNRGTNVLLANVNPAGGSTKINIPSVAGLPDEIPLEAGKLTFVVVRSL